MRWLVLAAVLAAAPATAQEAGEDPVLEELVREALARNPDLRFAEEALAAARSRPGQAGALPDPMLSVAYTNDDWAPTLGRREMTTLGVVWSQDLSWPGKRGLRSEIAAREADRVAQQLERGRLSLAAAVRRAYHGLRQSRMLLDLAREQGELWRQIEGVARARYTVGQGTQQDVLRTQIEVTRVGQLEAEQRAEETVRLAELNRLAGRPAETSVETPAAPPPARVGEPLSAVLARLGAISPELAAARTAVEEARLGVALARKEFKPDLTVQAGYMNRGGLDPIWQVGIGITLPLARGRRQAALAEAEARLRAAARRVEAVELQLRFRSQERLARLAAIERVTDLYHEGVVPQDQLSLEAAIASYRTGRVPFVTVLEALGTLYTDRGALIRLRTTHAQTRASLDEASLEASPDMPSLPAAGMVSAAMAAPTEGRGMRSSAGGMSRGGSMNR